MRILEETFSDVIKVILAGAEIMVKLLFLYILLPEIVVIIIVGVILKIRGRTSGVIYAAVALIGLCLFFSIWHSTSGI